MGSFSILGNIPENTKLPPQLQYNIVWRRDTGLGHKQKLGSRKNSMVYRTIALTIGNFYTQKVKWSLRIIWSQLDLKTLLANFSKNFQKIVYFQNE